ncbi:exosortase F-associated protein [Flavobacterium phragmitis]|uniref:Exosortase F-associated protein n=1 Tax=Flavobacterium phragmitis TaxID=739143 RepID=A0A1I1R2H4_9FLAO|nr:exosortase F system-associated protein [Flavobacterium phragmitis]SFD28515.1 exosortase F-associated protein [Flavobacterium phragmitis]
MFLFYGFSGSIDFQNMLDNLKQNKLQIFIAVIVILCFALIRSFETKLFYDPFLNYFKDDFKDLPYPKFNGLKLFFGLFFRYFLNSALSLLLIYTLFQNQDIFKFSLIVYSFFIVLLLVAFFVILEYFPNANWLLFYVRRFIIQPILVLLFIPGFYYQLQSSKK